jgi:hypothetical protein
MTTCRQIRDGASARNAQASVPQRQRRPLSREKQLQRNLERLPELDRASLVEQVVKLWGFRPPPRFSRKLMELAVAYKLQESVYGGLKPATRRFLLDAGEAHARPPKSRQASARFKAGTVLMREWQGVTHQVTVLADGYIFRGKRYRSLSEVAGLITGAHWSGPTFFGLTKPVGSSADERQ